MSDSSWSQVALELTKPDGLIVGIDLLPAQPPKGVTTFQGDFLSPMVQKLVKDCILEMQNRRELSRLKSEPKAEKKKSKEDGVPEEPQISYIDMERQASHVETEGQGKLHHGPGSMNMVDVVLSDMSAPWQQTSGYNVNTLSNPYHRLMNTSGIPFHDHARSLDLCNAALDFASDTLKPGGHFVCKVYVGRGDQDFEQRTAVLQGSQSQAKIIKKREFQYSILAPFTPAYTK
uniref:rRNA methyltransferase 2, mitochondrial n=1 Tax=Bionectria ochroleuca TaxID=29856 RepID=A0A0B7K7Q5_BIOOC